MKVTYNEKDYHGLPALLIAIPSMILIGIFLMAIGAALSSPLWVLIFLAQVLS